ncbi:MAG: carotenoid biosynthesis protein [Planctomycetota bacterium]
MLRSAPDTPVPDVPDSGDFRPRLACEDTTLDELLSRLLGTLTGRPYVFAFLAAFLVVAGMQLGWRRAVAFIPVGYAIAWASEKLSISTGFPYGWYHYRYDNLGNDLLVAGVPMFDSISYVFLSYVGWSMAITLLGPLQRRPAGPALDVRWTGDAAFRRRPGPIVLGAFLTMLMDVVVDPIAHKGDEWFLGQIYGYGRAEAPVHGEYFDILLANFAGWFGVALLIIIAFALVDRVLPRRGSEPVRHGDGGFAAGLAGAGLYYGILGFNLAVIIYVGTMRHQAGNADGAMTMVALLGCSVLWHAPFMVWLAVRVRRAPRVDAA